MSNKFYNYLSDKIKNFFKNSEIRHGDKFFIQFDEEYRVDDFYNTLKNDLDNVEEFRYKHENSNVPFTTFTTLLENGIKVVVVNSNKVSVDYLVTLRNQVTTQEGVWKDTALLLICYNIIDSIYDGMRNLEKEDMPLNINIIKNNLKDEINSSKLSKIDKVVTKFYLDKKIEDAFQTTLWDYEDILSIINKGEIEENDYKNLGLFSDSKLESYKSPKAKENRLEENADNFNHVSLCHQYDNTKEELEKRYDSSGVKLLIKDDWHTVDFNKIHKSHEKLLNFTKSLNYLENLNKFTNEGCIFWEKPLKLTAAGRRKRQIIVFNEDNKVSEVTFKFKFDGTLERTYLDKNSLEMCSISDNALKIKFDLLHNEPTFKKIKYKHNNQAKSTYEFNILVLPCKEDILLPIKDKYQINNRLNRIVVIDDNNEEISFGFGDNVQSYSITQDNEVINIYDEDTITIANDSVINENGVINFNLVYNDLKIPIQIKEDGDKSLPVESLTIWKDKREYQENFIFKNNKAVQGTNSFYLYDEFKKYLKMEKDIITNSIAYGERQINGNVKKIDLKLSDDLQSAFNKIINYYQSIDNLPSLVFLDNDLKLLYEEFIEQYNNEIESIEKDAIISSDERKLNLIKLGTIKDNDRILFTPVSPLNIAYQLEIANQCQNEILDKPILERLTPNNLLPYLYGDVEKHGKNLLYKPIYQNDAQEWIIFEKSADVSISSTNAFIAIVVKDKMNQFVSHFKYLFDKKAKSPIKLNIININEDLEIVKGIFNFVRDRLDDRKIKHKIPVEVNLYNDNMRSAFDDFFDCVNPDQLYEKFGITIKSREKDSMDILREVQDNITYFKHDLPDNDVEYAHISFYKVGYDATIADDNMDQIETGLSIDGLLSSITSFNTRLEYRTGFGTKHILNEENILVKTVINLNELSLNYQNNGENTYKKRKTIITKPMELKKDLTEVLYKKSRWVTFIEPSFGLEYFENEGDGSLIIIHYSDQYSSSTKYDTITVTSKSKQYKNVMEEFLSKKLKEEDEKLITDEKLEDVIKLFNSINGEWLLKIISTYGNTDREKISIISAIKYMLAILDNKDIIWIPISMEEILRIAGTVKLSKKEGIFDPKILDGKYCDDLLFVGINPKNNAEVYYYPIEVKIGINNESVVKKGMEQIDKTYNLLKDQLFDSLEDTRFRNKFYRNFFMQVALTNEQKLILNDLFNQSEIDMIDSLKSKFLNDDYNISDDLEVYIGKGAVVSFKQHNSFRALKKENNNLIVELTEDDAYYGLLKSFDEINDEIHNEKSEISSTYLLSNVDVNEKEYVPVGEDKPEDIIPEPKDGDSEVNTPNSTDPGEKVDEKEIGNDSTGSSEGTDSTEETFSPSDSEDLNNTRALIGTVDGSKHEIYWEFGNPKLGNRHLLIQGKSGQGKTYFIQRLIMELSKQKVPVIIIDYTDGFRPDKLEKEFVDVLGENLEQHIVIKDKFPLNPFKKYQNTLFDGYSIEEDNVDVATRFVSIIGSVYNQLGIQQRNEIYQAVLRGLDKKDVMDLKDLEEELINQDNAVASNALSQLQVFIDKNPFDSINAFDWSDINYPSSMVTVIQLTGINKDIQKIITEMILWDLWYYKTSHGGDEKQPFAVILDECQNLNFGNDSPCTKILQEGRKFGWSGWFATQFLKGKLDNNAINMLQNSEEQIYFNPPDNSVETIAKTLTKDNADKKYWESKLSGLKKGQCIVYGPTVENEEFISSKPNIVDVSPLSKE